MTALSKSALWNLMQNYYNQIGPQAWADELVPLQISCNKNLAAAYAQIIVAHVNDWLAANPGSTSKQPFYIIEIGAGHGRFGFYVLKLLEVYLRNYGLNLEGCVKYVMTDISEKNVAAWHSHPGLQSFLDNGILEVAVFDAVAGTDLPLRELCLGRSGILADKPIFMVGNYLFDSLPHDAFMVRDGKLYETNIEIVGTEFAHAKYNFSHKLIDAQGYYPDAALNQLLREYTEVLCEEGSFLLPIGGIECITNISKFTQQYVVALIADKGHADLQFFAGVDDPDISEHGSISLMVNFDSLRRYYQQLGHALSMHNQATEFQVAVLVTQKLANIGHTTNAFAHSMSAAAPQDLVNLCYSEEEVHDNFTSIEQILAVLNLTMWDPAIFYDLHEQLLEFIEDTDDDELNLEHHLAMELGARQVWEYYFKVESNQDVPFALGGLYYALDEYEQSLHFYQLSCKLFGENADNLYNLALCYQALEQDNSARKFCQQALKLDPSYEAASELLAEIA